MQLATWILILTVAVGASVYDVFAATNKTTGDTISAVLRTLSRDWWVVAYGWGLLGGHFFLGYPQALTTPGTDTKIALFVTWSIFVVNVLHFQRDWPDVPVWGYLLILLLGLGVGHFFWSQGGTAPLL